MFAFYESDWFTLALEVLFLLFIAYDMKRYIETRKREYLLNIAFAIIFFVWALVPFYNKYFSWQERDREALLLKCEEEHNSSYCSCLDDMIVKEYDVESYRELEKGRDEELVSFLKECDEECRGEGGWF